jgi:tripartite-type tricarboxylate transporter receptor subunit TctC
MKTFSLAALILVAGTIAGAEAQNFPSHPITIIAPTSPGGPPDTIGRILAERMRVTLGQPVIVENVTGAGGSIGVTRVARSAPDGYTISIGHLNSHVFTGAVYNLTFDLLKDLAPVTMLTSAPMLFVARKDFPPNTLKELVAWMKQHPKGATFSTVGLGSPGKIWATDLGHKIGIEFQFVPYRGAIAGIQDLLAGNIDLACVEASNIMSHLHGGKMKAYAVLDKNRWSVAPEVPTIDEAGAPNFYMTFWHGLWVPNGTPQDAIAKLNAAAVDALADPQVRERLARAGQTIVPREQQTPAALAAHQKAEIEKWWPIIRAAGVKPE